jgi:hypothetical protein
MNQDEDAKDPAPLLVEQNPEFLLEVFADVPSAAI